MKVIPKRRDLDAMCPELAAICTLSRLPKTALAVHGQAVHAYMSNTFQKAIRQASAAHGSIRLLNSGMGRPWHLRPPLLSPLAGLGNRAAHACIPMANTHTHTHVHVRPQHFTTVWNLPAIGSVLAGWAFSQHALLLCSRRLAHSRPPRRRPGRDIITLPYIGPTSHSSQAHYGTVRASFGRASRRTSSKGTLSTLRIL